MFDADVLASGDAPSLLLPAWPDIIWGTVAILIIAGAVFYFLPKLTKVIDARIETIESGVALADKVKAEAVAAEEENARLLADARAEGARIREEARAEGSQILSEMRHKAVVESDRITDAASRQIEAERSQAFAALRTNVGDLAIDLASKIVGESLENEARQSRVVDRFLDEMESATPQAGGGGR